jgi:NhaC family Na+:H+ antiporter
MSPLSETTNLAPAVSGTDLFTHIKYMLWTTVPSILIALAIFGVIGYTAEFSAPLDLTVVLEAIESIFRIGLLTLIPLLVVLIMSFRRISAFSTILAGALVGGIMAVILQPQVVLAFVDDPSLSTPVAMVKGVWSAMATGFVVNSEYEGLNDLFSRGGMSSMLETVWLIISAMAFGGVMEYTGLLAKLIQPLLTYSKSDRSILVSTSLTSIGINLVAGDQYMAIVLPGRMFRKAYQERNLAPETLSRQIEGSGTVTSPLIPWNSCGAYMSATLGIATMAYLPFCFFNLADALVTLLFAILGIKIGHIKPEEVIKEPPDKAAFYGIGGHRVEPTEHEVAVTG